MQPAACEPRIRLVGLQQRDLAPDDYSLIASAFKRLPAEVMRGDRPERIVGYASSGPGARRLQFMGVQVADIGHIPPGMVAWDMSPTAWTISESIAGRITTTWETPLDWMWSSVLSCDAQSSDGRRWIGEFRARQPGPSGKGNGDRQEERQAECQTACQNWQVFAVVPYSTGRPGSSDEIHIAEYDDTYPQQFDEMSQWLRASLGTDLALRIEHYGSTAVPGLPAKPIVDILVEVPSFEAAKRRVLPILSGETWEGWTYHQHLVFFQRRQLMGPRKFHVHFAPRGHRIWEGLAFRDYLRSHPAEAARYVELKRQLARTYRHDREQYTQSKTDLIQEMTATALAGEAVGGQAGWSAG